MSRWTPEMDEHTPSIVREAWRRQLFDDIAARRTERENKADVKMAIATGIIAGVVGSVAIYLFV
jgi:hypothetical protein